MKVTNKAGLALAPAVWLLEDDYEYNEDPYTISTTTLLNPVRAIVLAAQAKGDSEHEIDLVDFIGSRVGSALHDSLEACWKKLDHVQDSLKRLGINPKVVERIVINPAEGDILPEDAIVIYIENRSAKKLGNWTITGKYDLIMAGQVQDYKSGSVWGYIYGSNTENYTMQESIYRWLNPEKITEEKAAIHYIFTDWSKVKASQSKDYPQTRLLTVEIPLKNIHWTEDWIRNKLNQIEQFIDADQGEMPLCTPEELWQKEAVFKYYKNPLKKERATRNCKTRAEAEALQTKNGCGEIVDVPGEVVRCKYCSSIEICQQAQGYIQNGLIKFE